MFICQMKKMKKYEFEPACRRMEWLDPFYKNVWEKAFVDAIPISGTFELTPRCNFNCRMCYVHLAEKEIYKHGTEMTAKQWLRVAKEAKEAGTTWLCITGGEPLMHLEFETIWKEFAQMGFFITLQTNASLIQKFESLFQQYPPRKCKITLYGSNDEIYKKVCQIEKGFTKTDRGIQILKQMKIPIELVSTVIQQNLDDVENIIEYVGKNRLPWIPNINVRTAGRGVEVDMKNLRIPPFDYSAEQADNLRKKIFMNPERKPCTYCKDYRLGYWIVWNGYMRFCGFLNGPNISIRDRTFGECWKELVEFQEGLQWPEECRVCELQKSCVRCAALFDIKDGELVIKEQFCKKRRE